MWKYYVDKNEFEEALQKSLESPNLSKVKGAYADHLLENNNA